MNSHTTTARMRSENTMRRTFALLAMHGRGPRGDAGACDDGAYAGAFAGFRHDELLDAAELMLAQMNCEFGEGARQAFAARLSPHMQSRAPNAHAVRRALLRARLRQARRLFVDRDRTLSRDERVTLLPQDFGD